MNRIFGMLSLKLTVARAARDSTPAANQSPELPDNVNTKKPSSGVRRSSARHVMAGTRGSVS